jgi:hypothetical protein
MGHEVHGRKLRGMYLRMGLENKLWSRKKVAKKPRSHVMTLEESTAFWCNQVARYRRTGALPNSLDLISHCLYHGKGNRVDVRDVQVPPHLATPSRKLISVLLLRGGIEPNPGPKQSISIKRHVGSTTTVTKLPLKHRRSHPKTPPVSICKLFECDDESIEPFTSTILHDPICSKCHGPIYRVAEESAYRHIREDKYKPVYRDADMMGLTHVTVSSPPPVTTVSSTSPTSPTPILVTPPPCTSTISRPLRPLKPHIPPLPIPERYAEGDCELGPALSPRSPSPTPPALPTPPPAPVDVIRNDDFLDGLEVNHAKNDKFMRKVCEHVGKGHVYHMKLEEEISRNDQDRRLVGQRGVKRVEKDIRLIRCTWTRLPYLFNCKNIIILTLVSLFCLLSNLFVFHYGYERLFFTLPYLSLAFFGWNYFHRKSSRRRLVYSPHFVSSLIADFDREVSESDMKKNIRCKSRRLAALNIPDDMYVDVLNGSEEVAMMYMRRRNFYGGQEYRPKPWRALGTFTRWEPV